MAHAGERCGGGPEPRDAVPGDGLELPAGACAGAGSGAVRTRARAGAVAGGGSPAGANVARGALAPVAAAPGHVAGGRGVAAPPPPPALPVPGAGGLALCRDGARRHAHATSAHQLQPASNATARHYGHTAKQSIPLHTADGLRGGPKYELRRIIWAIISLTQHGHHKSFRLNINHHISMY